MMGAVTDSAVSHNVTLGTVTLVAAQQYDVHKNTPALHIKKYCFIRTDQIIVYCVNLNGQQQSLCQLQTDLFCVTLRYPVVMWYI